MKSILLLLILFPLLAGCAPTLLTPVTGVGFAFEEDEKRLWLRAAEEEKVLNESSLIYRDEELDTYLNTVAGKLVTPEIYKAIPFNVRVVKNPYLNAFTFPDGNLYIHTGILARMDNEAQLAAILGHEMSHAINRHALRETRNIKSKTAFLATLQVALAGLPFGDLASLFGQLGTMAAVTGYSRELETEADAEGIQMVVSAGYDPEEAPKLVQYLQKEVAEEKKKEPFFFGTHPRLKERLENFETLLRTRYFDKKDGTKNAEVFLQKVHPVILENARLDLKTGRFSIAQRGIEKYLAIRPNDAKGYFLLGETCRQRGEKDDLEKARGHYQKAISLDPSYPDPYKSLGVIAYKQKDAELARKYLERFLSLAPQAPDKGYIEEMLKNLR